MYQSHAKCPHRVHRAYYDVGLRFQPADLIKTLILKVAGRLSGSEYLLLLLKTGVPFPAPIADRSYGIGCSCLGSEKHT